MKRKRQHIIPVLLILSFCGLNTVAQPVVNAVADKNRIRIGEPITVRLTAIWPGKAGFTSGFVIPDSISHFEVWDKQNPVIIKDGIEQLITITSYDSGLFTIPAFRLTTPNANEPRGYITKSISVEVVPVNVDSLKDYHDIKDIIEVPPIPQWPYILAIAVITLASGIGLYFLLKKLGVGKKPTRKDYERGMNPYTFAMTELDKLEADAPHAAAKVYFTRLTNIYRNYLSDAHNFRSHQQTGGELILQAKPLLQQDKFFEFANTIRLADAAKFAKYDPPKEERITSVKDIREAVKGMEKTVPDT